MYNFLFFAPKWVDARSVEKRRKKCQYYVGIVCDGAVTTASGFARTVLSHAVRTVS